MVNVPGTVQVPGTHIPGMYKFEYQEIETNSSRLPTCLYMALNGNSWRGVKVNPFYLYVTYKCVSIARGLGLSCLQCDQNFADLFQSEESDVCRRRQFLD